MTIQEAEKLVTEKTDDELLQMLARPEDWQPVIVDAAKSKLRQKGVVYNPPLIGTELAIQAAKPRDPICGVLSLLVFCGSVFVFFRIIGEEPPGVHGEHALGYLVAAVMISCYISIPSLLLGVIGLLRAERPIWPAITGTALSALPALGGVYIACGAPL